MVTPSLLGRDADLARVRELADGALVCIVGPGGVGKSALARAIAEEDEWPLCDFEAAGERALLTALQQHFGVVDDTEGGDALLERVAEACAARPTPVLVDGADAHLEDARETLAALLAAAPSARFVVTSREPLGLADERVHRLAPLAEDSATQLFVRAARRVRPGFSATGADRARVAEIVEAVDRLPLAVELAAARVRLLSLDEVRERVAQQLELLRDRGAARPARHLSLRACVEASFADLDVAERAVLAQCSIFAGAFETRAAERVVELPDDAPPALDVLEELERKSLLRAEPAAPGGGARVRLFEAVRQLAVELLDDERRASVRERLLAWAVPVAAELRRDARGPDGPVARARLRSLSPVMRAAFELATTTDPPAAVEIALALWEVWSVHGPLAEGIDMLAAAVASAEGAGDGERAALCRVRRARLLRFAGRVEEAAAELARVRTETDGRDEPERAVANLFARVEQSRAHLLAGDLGAARAVLADARERAEALAEPLVAINVWNAIGGVNLYEGDLEEAERCFVTALGRARTLGNTTWECALLNNVGVLNMRRGEIASARSWLLEAREAALASDGTARLPTACGSLGLLALAEGRIDEGEAFAREGLGYAQQLGRGIDVARMRGELGMALALGPSPGDAVEPLHETARALERAGESMSAAFHLGFAGVARALVGDRDAARQALQLAEALAGTGTRHRAHEWLDIARQLLDGDEDEARRAYAALEPRMPISHIAARVVGRLFEPADSPSLAVTEGGDRLRLAAADPVDLRRRAAPRAIFWRLVQAHAQEEGALTVDELFAAGWGGERALPDARKNRVYVALSTLRKLGLAPWLQTDADGYRLDPALRLEIRAPDAEL